ncbi:sn-glycerol-3-phosphate ABC transporter ATP-binding protein UgpC [Undibacterium cyanobacteriorum]|uniref:Sn-glycerol-3-phosphate ABC transporter ATP-binding protein UgpC n=1 Tax=Undibacterium cyanobacteriorum TaxID=3073561 RepID=A0ABY9RE13_9BURK|nr:sn-glycerol-3-phosphate ABC transporter ATP-binding protein UgpC [Undibacterium sp. 20NA77.5]WMW79477.1 sn-glycerol-3-phosphate ABC transporter ATP-binding protein UgpC [Undibacterium sp. 20NA77.5]
MTQVRLQQIRKSYADGTEVIRGIDLAIEEGEFMVFVGPSGCGKSTLLRMIAGLEEISSGELFLEGELANHVPPAKRGLAMVFQSYALYPHMNVYENMAFSLRMAGKGKTEIEAAVSKAASILQIEHLLQRKPKDLSGGQRQRVAIGRAIVRQPRLFLFDEPLSNLDASLRVQMRIELSRLHQELKTTMIYVTHDQVEAMTLGHRIVVFNGGHIEQIGQPLELYEKPANMFVAGFLGSPKMNFVEVEAVASTSVDANLYATKQVSFKLKTGAHIEIPSERFAREIKLGNTYTLGCRAEHISVCSLDEIGAVPAQCQFVEHLGDACIVYAALADHHVIAIKTTHAQAIPQRGENFGLRFSAQHCHVFDAQGVRM